MAQFRNYQEHFCISISACLLCVHTSNCVSVFTRVILKIETSDPMWIEIIAITFVKISCQTERGDYDYD